MKATFNQAALKIGIHTVDNFNKVLAEMTNYAFLAYAFCEQTRYLHRHLVKPRSMKLCSFVGSFQDLNDYLGEFPSDTEEQETESLYTDDVMDIFYHSMPTTWKNNMIKQRFNHSNSIMN